MRRSCHCFEPNLHRVARSGFMDYLLLRAAGLYPWICEDCGTRVYQKRRRKDAPGRVVAFTA